MNKRQKKKFNKKYHKKKYHKLQMYILPVGYIEGRIMITCKFKCHILGYDFVDLTEYIKTDGKSFTCRVSGIDKNKVNEGIKWYIDNFYKKEDDHE